MGENRGLDEYKRDPPDPETPSLSQNPLKFQPLSAHPKGFLKHPSPEPCVRPLL